MKTPTRSLNRSTWSVPNWVTEHIAPSADELIAVYNDVRKTPPTSTGIPIDDFPLVRAIRSQHAQRDDCRTEKSNTTAGFIPQHSTSPRRIKPPMVALLLIGSMYGAALGDPSILTRGISDATAINFREMGVRSNDEESQNDNAEREDRWSHRRMMIARAVRKFNGLLRNADY
jgi:hypothetical protein